MTLKFLLALALAGLALIFAVMAAIPAAQAACVQVGQVYQMTVRPAPLAASVWIKPGAGNTFYTYTTADPTLQAVLAGWVGQRVTFYGDAAACPDSGPVRDAGKLTAVILSE